MRVHYSVIHASGRVEKLTADFKGKGDRGRLDDIRRVFERHLPGCEMEHVSIWSGDTYLDMFIDEIGKLKRAPFNEQATLMYWANMREHEPLTFQVLVERNELDVIAGDAIVFEEKVWE